MPSLKFPNSFFLLKLKKTHNPLFFDFCFILLATSWLITVSIHLNALYMKKEIAGQLRPCRLNFSLKWIWQLSYCRQCSNNNITTLTGYIHGIFFTQKLICNSENSAWTLSTSEMDYSFTGICWSRFLVVQATSALRLEGGCFWRGHPSIWYDKNHPFFWLSEEMFFAFRM